MTSEAISTQPRPAHSSRAMAALPGRPLVGYASAVLTALAFAPMTLFHLRDVWARPHYEFLPLLLPAAGALLWQRCRNLGALEPGHRGVALGLMGLAWSLLALSILFVTTWLGGLATLVVLLAGAYAVGGTRLTRAVLPAWVMLAMALPPPFHLDVTLVGRLQALVSARSSDLLDALEITHVMEGNVINLGSRPLLVDQACSGIYSLFTLGICTLFYMLWTRASWARLAIVLVAAAAWVIIGNVLRVAAIAVLFVNYNIDATSGRKHTALGLAGFLLMLAAVACTDRLVTFFEGLARLARSAVYGTRRKFAKATWHDLLHWAEYIDRWESRQTRRSGSGGEGASSKRSGEDRPPSGRRTFDAVLDAASGRRPAKDAPAPPPRARRPEPVPTPRGPTQWPSLARCWPGRPAAAAAFLVLLPPQFLLPGYDMSGVLADRAVEARAFGAYGPETLPERAAGFARTGFAPVHRDHDLTWGEDSRLWGYASPAGQATVSLDYPFVGWHDLSDCYVGRGWRVVGRTVEPDPSGGGTVLLDLTRDDGRALRVVFGLFDRERRALTPPYTRLDLVDLMQRRLAMWGLGGAAVADMAGPTHQVQVAFESPTPLPPAAEGGPDLLGLYRAVVAAVHREPLTARAAGESKP